MISRVVAGWLAFALTARAIAQQNADEYAATLKRAESFSRRGNIEQAIAEYRRLTELRDDRLFLSSSQSLIREGRHADSVALLEQGLLRHASARE